MLPKVRISVPVGLRGSVSWPLLMWAWCLRGERDGRTCELQLEVLEGKPVCETRNKQCMGVIRSAWAEHVLFVDDDAIPEMEGFDLLLEAVRRPDVDVVGGWSVMWWDEDNAVPMLVRSSRHREGGAPQFPKEFLEKEPGLYELKDTGLATHCLLVKRKVLEAFYERGVLWFEDEFEKDRSSPRYGLRNYGHDVRFCDMARELGFRTWVDTRVFWGHVKKVDMRNQWLRNLVARQEVHAHADLARIWRRMWGNVAFTAPEDFLLRLCHEARRMPGGTMAVECGSGLSTLVLHESAPDRFVSLESDPVWAADLAGRAPTAAQALRICRFRDYGAHEWYELPPDVNGTPVSLVVCDGPKGDACRGGRVGMLDALLPHLAEEFTLMVDDANVEQGRDALEAWLKREDVDLKPEYVDCASDGVNPPRRFAVVKGRKKEAVHG